jgi:ribosome-associated protein
MDNHKILLKENGHEKSIDKDLHEAHCIIKALDDKHAMDILLLDLRDFTTVSDAFILATATSETHLQTLQDITEETMEELGLFCQLEGQTSNRWRLVDAGHIVVHLFSKEGRKFYGLERIWGDAPYTQFGEPSE